jgi:2-C-methyl-D-erythritol 4-phosphate cytidylyltransferase / 2-C-methyl-D-erythritol 2,4-cyclodiphosphate synthase
VTTAVVIVAAGSGTRLGSNQPKAFVPLAGSTLLEQCAKGVQAWPTPFSLVVVAPPGWETPARQLLSQHGDVTVVTGGETRTDSVRAGLAALPAGTTTVLIHDAARALTPVAVFDRVLNALSKGAKGVVPQIPVVDTLISVDRSSMATGDAVDRSVLGAVQTPQGFQAAALIAAYDAIDGDFTDDAAVLRAAGHEVVAVDGDAMSFKITYPADLQRAASVLGATGGQRVGTAVDVHQFDSGVSLTLAGLVWPGEDGLAGHSDGDVVIHAIVDAILQAAGLGDLGTHFGANRPEFEGANSRVFLEHALTLVRDAGYVVSSVGVQVIAQKPKIGPRRLEAQTLLSELVGCPVALSATTSDGLGFTGRGEGAAALATAVLVAI